MKKPASNDWQGTVLQVMWFKDARAVSDRINCYPVLTSTNNYNNWGPIIRDLEVILQIPNDIKKYSQPTSYPPRCPQLLLV